MWLSSFLGALARAADHARATGHAVLYTFGFTNRSDGAPFVGGYESFGCLDCEPGEGTLWNVASHHVMADPDERLHTFAGREALAAFHGFLLGDEGARAFRRSRLPSRYQRDPLE